MSTRERFIETTRALLEAQGYHGTGLNQIVTESGAPKGSLYYHFPDGKEELTVQAIERAGEAVVERIHANLSVTPVLSVALRSFVERIADGVEASDYQSGGPLQTVALETATSSERVNQACRAAYTRLQGAFADRIAAAGYGPAQAAELATFITAAIEGGIMLSRTYHTGEPLRLVARQLGDYLQAVPPAENGAAADMAGELS
jgi:TetR/AcrR family transcriptional repressor of lmrAB and yxaGH operons